MILIFMNITNREIKILTIGFESMNLYDLSKELKVARQNGFVLSQINKLTTNFYQHLRYTNIKYYLKSRIPMCHRQFYE